MNEKNSHLTIRDDLVEEGLSIPVHFLDYKEDVYIEQTDTLNIDCIFSTDGEELHEGMNIIVSITEPTQKDKYGDIFVDTQKSKKVYQDWLSKTRPSPGPQGLRRPLWLKRPLRPKEESFYLDH